MVLRTWGGSRSTWASLHRGDASCHHLVDSFLVQPFKMACGSVKVCSESFVF